MSQAVNLSFTEIASIPEWKPEDYIEGVHLYWLGQAGFLLDAAEHRIVIDAYLSDSLAQKYKGSPLPHLRMEESPIEAGAIHDVDFVFSSHSHTDHMDGPTLAALALTNPHCRFIVPSACLKTAIERGVPADRLIGANDGDMLDLGRGLMVEVLPAAHENLEMDEKGQHRFLGFVFRFKSKAGDLSVYHSGDCVPWEGLEKRLMQAHPDLLLLPVNGRDAERTAGGIIGNFTLDESIDLVHTLSPAFGLGHHFGMFDFNTIDEAAAQRQVSERCADSRFVLVRRLTRIGLRHEERAHTR